MIHYHGGPITPIRCAREAWRSRHAFISFARTDQLALAAEICQSFALDNGAFSVWRRNEVPDWPEYYRLIDKWRMHPGFDFAIIPDVIDGTAEDNDELIAAWPFDKSVGVPVWHMHEPISRLCELAAEWPRVALGSSGQFQNVGDENWWERMTSAMNKLTANTDGSAPCKLHGLRMLSPTVFSHLPLSSADSTSVARNIGLDVHWKGRYLSELSKQTRAAVLIDRIEAHASASRWEPRMEQMNLGLLG